MTEYKDKNKDIIVMGIETSCDETACALVKNGRTVLSNIISSQIDLHAAYGGVVPEIASRKHVETILPVIDQALSEAGIVLDDVDAIGVSYGPGLVGALLVGISAAKSIAFASGKPLVAVNHIEGHISANYIAAPTLEPPFLCLVVSGGHTEIVLAEDYGIYKVMAATRDDAAGEAFDKIARVLGLGYPGGPAIQKAAAAGGDPRAVRFPRVTFGGGSLDFSFSGLKTAAINHINSERQRGAAINVADTAASYQAAIVEILADNTIEAAQRAGTRRIAMAGGVAANSALRELLAKKTAALGCDFYCPPPVLCTDNAAMIACAAFYRYIRGETAGLDLNAVPSLELGE